jgi:hypothetical protein
MRDIWVYSLVYGLISKINRKRCCRAAVLILRAWFKAYWAGVLSPGFDWLGTHVHGLLMVLGLGLNWCKWSFVGGLECNGRA